MAFNPWFPANYQPYQPQYQQQSVQTRAVEAIPVDDENAVVGFPVALGATALFISKNDRFVAFKSNNMNGESEVMFFDRRPPAPAPEPFDPSQYVRRDELDRILKSVRKDDMYEPIRQPAGRAASSPDEPAANASAAPRRSGGYTSPARPQYSARDDQPAADFEPPYADRAGL